MVKKMSYYFPDLTGCCILFFLILGGMFLGGLIVSETIRLLTMAGLLHTSPNELSAWFLPVASIIGYIPAMLFIFFKGKSEMSDTRQSIPNAIRKFDSNRFGSLHPILFAGIATAGLVALVILTDPISEILPEMPEWVKNSFDSIQSSLLPSVLSTCIIAPLFEEFLCRGVVLRGLLHKEKPATAIILSAAFFALMHMNLWQSIPAFLFGLWFGWLYYKTGSLKTVIGLHALNNTASLLICHFGTVNMDDSLRTVIGNGTLFVLILLASAIILCLSIFTINKHIPSYKRDNIKHDNFQQLI